MKREAMVPIYFHLGGIVGGSLGLSALAVFRQVPGWAAAAAPALIVAPVLLVICAAILTGHLTKPERFWRVLTRFKWGSPVSVGAWALTSLGLLSALLSLGILTQGGLAAVSQNPEYLAILGLAALLGWFLTAYTGVLLTASSIAVWTRTNWLGAVFCVSGLAAGAAWMRFLLVFVAGPEAALAAPGLETITIRLLMMALAGWFFLDRALIIENEYHSQRGIVWAGLVLGYALPILLLDQGGLYAEAGALLALTGGVAPRAAIVFSGVSHRTGS